MAWSLIDSASVQSTLSPMEISGRTTTGADLLLLLLSDSEAASLGEVFDNGPNVWTPLTTYVRSGAGRVKIWYADAPTVGSGHSFQYSNGTGTFAYATLTMLAFSGAHATAPFDKENGTNFVNNQIQPGAVTPVDSGSLVITFVTLNTSSSVNINGSYITPVVPFNYNSGTGAQGQGYSYWDNAGTSSTNPLLTFGATLTSAATIAVFKPAGGGAGAYRVASRYRTTRR